VGSTLFHMLTKSDPQSYNFKFPPLSTFKYQGTDGQERAVAVSPSLEKVVQKCLQLKPEDRYPDAASLRHDLEIALREAVEPQKGTRSLNPGLVALLYHPRTTAAQNRAALWAFWKDWLVRTFVQKATQPRPPIHRGP
jgi:serine/threonine protein kinase